jgi:putative ABC transport system permease protein
MDTLLRDLRYGLRMLAREPGFTLLAILALALGTGATTAIFTVVDSVLLRPLPYRAPDRLVVALHGPAASSPVSPADYLDYRREAASFDGLGVAQAWGVTVGGDRPERLAGLKMSANMFDLLGVSALAGRTFVEGDDRPGHDRIVVLGHALWQRRFGGDSHIVGRTIPVDGRPFLVVGIMPASFRFAPFWATRAEIWTPLDLADRVTDRAGRSLRMFGRLKDGVSVAQAQAEMTGIAARLERDHPATNTDVRITVRPLLDKVVAGIRPTLLALVAMVTCVLLIACANVANTLLARASGRQREMALRVAIGASRARVVRQLLTESLLLSGLGAFAGLAMASWGVHALLAALPPGSLPRQQEVGFSAGVFLVAALATVVAGVATGLAPALHVMRTSLSGAFQDGGKGATDSGGRTRARSALVVVEVALALVLLAGAGLMGRTMINLSAVDPGFDVDHLAVASVSLAGTPYAEPGARAPMFLRVRERLAAVPGVAAVSAINHLPIAGDVWTLGYTVDGRPPATAGHEPAAVYRIVQPGYFSAMGLRLLAGRDILDADAASAAPVAVINQAMAQRQWPGESPIGRRIHLPGMSRVQEPITIVGVASNARQGDWTSAPDDEVYLAFAQRAAEFGLDTMTFVVRTDGNAGRLAASISREVAQVDRGLSVSGDATMTRVVADALWRERITASLAGLFAIVATGLAAIGVYAVVAYAVTRRSREFGVRVALGATRGHVQRLALADALGPVAIGVVIGMAAAMAGASLIEALLFEVRAIDPLTIVGAAAVLLLVASGAAWLPARRASRQDPVAALARI